MDQSLEKKQISNEEKRRLTESALFNLLNKQQFYGSLIQELNIRFTEAVPTMAISYNPKRDLFEMLININFFAQFGLDVRSGLLFHEILHFTHKHIVRWMRYDKWQDDAMLLNIASDMSINQYIQHLPKECVDVKNFKQKDGKPFPLLKSLEEYYNLLYNTDGSKFSKRMKSVGPSGKEENKSEGGGSGDKKEEKNKGNKQELGEPKTPNEDELGKYSQNAIDEHMFDDVSEEELENMLKETKKLIQRTIEKTTLGHDKVPGEVQDLLKQIDATLNGINYKKIIKDCIKRTICLTDREHTWNRPSKRYGVYSPGTVCGKVPSLGIFADTSGSISYTEFNEFLLFVDSLLKVGAKNCYLGLWHTELYKVLKYKKADNLKEGDINAGGTDPTCVLDYIEEKNYDLNIIITDGCFGDSRTIPKGKNILWVISKNGQEDHPLRHIGKTVKMK